MTLTHQWTVRSNLTIPRANLNAAAKKRLSNPLAVDSSTYVCFPRNVNSEEEVKLFYGLNYLLTLNVQLVLLKENYVHISIHMLVQDMFKIADMKQTPQKVFAADWENYRSWVLRNCFRVKSSQAAEERKRREGEGVYVTSQVELSCKINPRGCAGGVCVRVRACACVFVGSSYARSSVVTAVKFTISDQPQPIDPLLKNCIGKK